MLTLAIECATRTISLAILDEEDIRAELYLSPGRHHTEVLLTALEQLFLLAGQTPDEVDLLACTVGPGSFTGLRIGVSTVKGLALAMSRPVVGVSTLEALAMNAASSPGLICPMLDAGKNQVYTGLFRMGPDGHPQTVASEKLIEIATFLKELDQEEIVFLGEGAVRHEKLISQTLTDRIIVCGRSQQKLMASAVGLIGLHRYRNGGVLDMLTFTPRYLRLPEAETNAGFGVTLTRTGAG
jgi:tRNA threonylcarbamoyladenosine biosynthesis protein TsaB